MTDLFYVCGVLISSIDEADSELYSGLVTIYHEEVYRFFDVILNYVAEKTIGNWQMVVIN